jgi:hypothetical protein
MSRRIPSHNRAKVWTRLREHGSLDDLTQATLTHVNRGVREVGSLASSHAVVSMETHEVPARPLCVVLLAHPEATRVPAQFESVRIGVAGASQSNCIPDSRGTLCLSGSEYCCPGRSGARIERGIQCRSGPLSGSFGIDRATGTPAHSCDELGSSADTPADDHQRRSGINAQRSPGPRGLHTDKSHG